jgi:hypothetical protein
MYVSSGTRILGYTPRADGVPHPTRFETVSRMGDGYTEGILAGDMDVVCPPPPSPSLKMTEGGGGGGGEGAPTG